jgi:hypothetical protein
MKKSIYGHQGCKTASLCEIPSEDLRQQTSGPVKTL